jgi:hypothetical protein
LLVLGDDVAEPPSVASDESQFLWFLSCESGCFLEDLLVGGWWLDVELFSLAMVVDDGDGLFLFCCFLSFCAGWASSFPSSKLVGLHWALARFVPFVVGSAVSADSAWPVFVPFLPDAEWLLAGVADEFLLAFRAFVLFVLLVFVGPYVSGRHSSDES